METDRKWIIVRIDGKIAAISTDYRQLAAISARLAKDPKQKFGEITATAVDFEYIWKLRQEASWDDLLLYGTDFQKKVWKKLFDLTHLETSCSTDALCGGLHTVIAMMGHRYCICPNLCTQFFEPSIPQLTCRHLYGQLVCTCIRPSVEVSEMQLRPHSIAQMLHKQLVFIRLFPT